MMLSLSFDVIGLVVWQCILTYNREKFCFWENKSLLGLDYMKKCFNMNLYALQYADPRGFRRGYTALGAQTKWPILMMNWYKKNNNLEKINYLIKPLTQLCLNVLRQTFDLRTKNKKRWIIDFISVHVYEFDHFTYIIAEVLWVSLNKAHSNRVPK